MTIANSIHDKTFKSAMADTRVAQEFFEMYLPEKILSLIDTSTLKLSPNSYIDEDLNALASDVLYQVKLKDKGTGYIYVLCEHQSKVDPLMAFRLWSYVMRIWHDVIKQTGSKTLPLVFPFVFYHGKEPYYGPRSLRELIQAPVDIVNTILFNDFHLVDTHHIEDEELQKQHWAGVLAFMFKHVYDRDIWPHMQALISMMKKVEAEDGAVTYINNLLKYWVVAAEIKGSPKDFVDTMQEGLSTPIKGEIMTLAEQWKQEGFNQGIDQGIHQGIHQGEKALLIRQLERKFTKIPPHYQQRLEQANSEMLLNWGDRVLVASTLAEVFDYQ